jgi:hypothetical protein
VIADAFSPYDGVPPRQNWNLAVNGVADRAAIDVQGPVKFRFPRTAALASAGSCFANALSAYFAGADLRYPVYEPGAEPVAARHGTSIRRCSCANCSTARSASSPRPNGRGRRRGAAGSTRFGR